MRWVVLALACACGRLGFDPASGDKAGPPGGDPDSAMPPVGGGDGPPGVLGCADTDLGSALGPAVAQGTLTNADGDDFQSCAGNHSPDRAFAWTAPAAGSYTFSTCNSDPSWDSVLLVYTDAASCSDQPMCRDDDCGMHERITLTLTAGQRIVVVIDGWLDRGAYVLDITQN
jgi:hypothetical protein